MEDRESYMDRIDAVFPEPRTPEEFATEEAGFEAWAKPPMLPLRPCPRCGSIGGLVYCKNCHGERVT